MEKVNRKRTQGLETRAHLVAAARTLFAARGFAETGTEEVVRTAGVTRGALYHQFADKTALFAAAFEAVAAEVRARIEREAEASAGAVGALVAGSIAFLDAATDPAIRRIYLVDGPAVLGWAAWREIDARHGMASLSEGVAAALAGPPARAGDAEALTHLLSGALDALALWVADDPSARPRAHAEVARVIAALFAD